MCNCANENGKKTPFCNHFCDCVDWPNGAEWASHLRDNLVLDQDVLTYDSLESLDSKPPVLCVLGKCKKCGRQICIGGVLEGVQSFDALMESVFRNVFCCDRSSESEIEIAVIQLLHENDRQQGLDWIYVNRNRR